MSVTIETAKLMVEHLKGIVPDAEVRRTYWVACDPSELDELGKIALCVEPVGRDAERYTNGGMQKHELAVDIFVYKKLNHMNDEHDVLVAEIDELVAFAEKIYALFLKKVEKNERGMKAAFMQPEHVVLVDSEMLKHNCFLSVVRVNAEVYVKPEV